MIPIINCRIYSNQYVSKFFSNTVTYSYFCFNKIKFITIIISGQREQNNKLITYHYFLLSHNIF